MSAHEKITMLLSINSRIVDPLPNEDQFRLNEDQINERLLVHHREHGAPVKVLGLPMSLARTASNLQTLVLVKNERIVYCSVFQIIKYLSHKEVSQSNVWTDNLEHSVRGLARRVMLDYFVTKYGAIGSSHHLYPLGYNMWEKLLADVIPNYHVYMASSLTILRQINDLEDLRKMLPHMFGRSPHFEQVRAVISKNPIPISEMESL